MNTPPVTKSTPLEVKGVATAHARNANVVLELLNPVGTKGGLILPTAVQDRVRTGLVVSVGDGILCFDGRRVPIGLSVGDLVAIRPGRGLPFAVGGRVFLVVDQAEIPVVYRTADGKQLTDPDAVDPLTVRRRGGDLKAAANEDGEPVTESVDGETSDPSDRLLTDDMHDGQARDHEE